ncbi:hypothetical protein QBC46DRAFT_312613 [Diplogelasinospora grovesii]|uniref:Uncharacterized protein n=1 Tax=Diplogelasinospora grovesii TaxID=303347 RepID=A0AAN6N810_9PEZI|nr:hypothetical protein QBC46DRAFT_312613 [Diplogelasinospora grovesii]
MEWTKKQYNAQYEKWVPWLEDLYLRYFTRDNKASYAARDNLDKTKVTGIKQVDTLQDGVNNLITSQVGQGGFAQPIGDMASREGINRAERQGRDDKGGYVPQASVGVPVVEPVARGGQQAAGAAQSGLRTASGMLGFGGNNRKE